MHTLLALGVTVLTASSPAQPTLAATQPFSVVFVMPKFEQAISSLAQMTGVTIEIDQTVGDDIRQQPVADTALNFRDVKLEEAIRVITRLKGLSYTVVDEKSIRIFKA
jgi:hypothetical protein